ncbi:hypothetical protein [Akkermansia phage Chantilly]|nr:hypothetical protein [Akkermansia phage Chantilly]
MINRELINTHNIFIIIILHFYHYANITPQRILNVKIYARLLSFLVFLFVWKWRSKFIRLGEVRDAC